MAVSAALASESNSTGTQPSRPLDALHHFQPGNSSSSRPTLTFSPAATESGSGYWGVYSRMMRVEGTVRG